MPKGGERNYNIKIGKYNSGPLGKITDVPGVKVGHAITEENGIKAGVTVIMPVPENIYTHKCYASSFFLNCVGKSVGLNTVRESGVLEAPIGLTSTANVSAVQEALGIYIQNRCKREGRQLEKINAVVCECADIEVNRQSSGIITEKHVMAAISSAGVNFPEGNIGAGSSALTYGLSGGIGSASRVLPFDGINYTVGVITMSNYGVLNELIAGGHPLGEELAEKHGEKLRSEAGSCVTVLATDIPLTSRQIGRILRRSSVAITRMGGKTSCEAYVGFTTAGRMLADDKSDFFTLRALNEKLLNKVICAAADAIEESVLRSMLYADKAISSDGTVFNSLSELL